MELHRGLKGPFIKEKNPKHCKRYLDRLSNHRNPLAISLLNESKELRRLKMKHFPNLLNKIKHVCIFVDTKDVGIEILLMSP